MTRSHSRSAPDLDPVFDLVLAIAVAVALAACGGKAKPAAPTITTSTSTSRPPAARPPADQTRTATITPDAPARESDPTFAPIRFDFDSSDLSAPSRDELQALATWMGRNQVRITVEGHADERGTTEYNLALGQQRAEAIARHLGRLGIDGARVKTITYGEERPAIDGADEQAWAANRRGELRPDR